jgi:hypothetical protein
MENENDKFAFLIDIMSSTEESSHLLKIYTHIIPKKERRRSTKMSDKQGYRKKV